MENIHFWYRAMEGLVINLIHKYKSPGKIKILDAGCGTGGMAKKLKKFGNVTAIDINPVALEYAKKKKLDKLIRATVERLPFSGNQFDIIVCLDVLYHQKVKSDFSALKELYRVLKPGGLFILRLPAFEALRGSHDIVVHTRRRYTIKEVGIKMNSSGFKIIKLTYANMFLSVPLFIKRSYESLWQKQTFTSDTALLPDFINKIFYLILTIENKMLNYISFPFGSSVICIGMKE